MMGRLILALACIVVSSAASAQAPPITPPKFGEPTAADIVSIQRCTSEAVDHAALKACADMVSSRCMEEPGSETTAGMVMCQVRSTGAWDSALNAAYGALMKSESPSQRAALRTAQLAWITWRDAGCAYEASVFEGGSLARVIHADCTAQKTAERAIELIARQRGPEFE